MWTVSLTGYNFHIHRQNSQLGQLNKTKTTRSEHDQQCKRHSSHAFYVNAEITRIEQGTINNLKGINYVIIQKKCKHWDTKTPS